MATTFYQKKNNAKSTITNNPLTSGGLSITLASSTGALFPTTGATWLATIWSTNADPSVATDTEVVLIDSRSTDTLTVNASGRGYAGTTAVSHPTGSYIQLLVMKEHMTQYETAINTLEASSVGTYTAWTAYTPTWYKTDNTTTYTWSSSNCRYMRLGNKVTVHITVTSPSSAPGFNTYMSLPPIAAYNHLSGTDNTLNCIKIAGTGFDSAGSLGWVNINDASSTGGTRVRINPHVGTSMGADVNYTGTFSYEVA